MTTPNTIRLLYVGKNRQIAEDILDALKKQAATARYVQDFTSHELCLTIVSNQKQAWTQVCGHAPHCVMVEIDRRYSRERFCRRLRDRLAPMRIVAVCATDIQEIRFSFDEYVTIPIQKRVASRLLSLLLDTERTTQLQVGPIRLNTLSRQVFTPQGQATLPLKQCALLQMLMERAGSLVRRDEIMQVIWQTAYLGDTRTLDVHVHWLREQIEPDPSNPVHILTVKGEGFIFSAGPSA